MKKPPTLNQQIKALEAVIKCAVRSHTHLIGRYKGTIPPGPQRDEVEALKAALATVREVKMALWEMNVPEKYWTK